MLAMDEMMRPVLGCDVFVARTAYIGGDVVVGDQTTIMHHVVVRGDFAPIRIGSRVNLQDGVVLHTANETPLEIGDDVSVGHRAVLHGRRIGSRTLIGIGAILLDYCEIGGKCIIGAGTVVTPGTIVPEGSVVMGVPGRVVRKAGDDDLATIDYVVQNYLRMGRLHSAGHYPNIVPDLPNP